MKESSRARSDLISCLYNSIALIYTDITETLIRPWKFNFIHIAFPEAVEHSCGSVPPMKMDEICRH